MCAIGPIEMSKVDRESIVTGTGSGKFQGASCIYGAGCDSVEASFGSPALFN